MSPQQAELIAEQAELTAEQIELIEKLNCLEFETSQLNRAYQLWRSYVEQRSAPDWMAAAIRITYDSLIAFCLEVSTILADVPHGFSARPMAQLEAAVGNISGNLGEESTTVGPSPELMPMTEPDWPRPEMPAATSPPSTGDTISEHSVQQDQREDEVFAHAFSARLLAQSKVAAGGISGLLGEKNTTSEPSPESMPMTEPDWPGPEMPAGISPPSTGDTISEHSIQQDQREDEV